MSGFLFQFFQLFQPSKRFVQSLLFPGKMQADQVVDLFPEKAGSRNGGHANLFDHPLAEFQIRKAPELRQLQKLGDINQYKIGPLGHVMFQPDPIQSRQKIIPFFRVSLQQLFVIILRILKAHCRRLL